MKDDYVIIRFTGQITKRIVEHEHTDGKIYRAKLPESSVGSQFVAVDDGRNIAVVPAAFIRKLAQELGD